MSFSEASFHEIKKGIAEVLSENELKELLLCDKKLKIKAGFDPTSSDLHLGHTVLLNKLRKFQDFGHDVFFLIGDFTAMIGDPTGRNVMRPPMSKEEILQNANTYAEQAFKILKKDKTTILFNSEWLKNLSLESFVKMTSACTVARMLEREDFSKRYELNKPISIQEFLYPFLQGYDSVFLDADIEIGGTDQKFNLLMGRELQRHFNKRPQVVITMPLLEGLDGIKKMSKSLKNYVGITDEPIDMFGKIMSISDELMWRYFDLVSFRSIDEISALKKSVNDGSNPMYTKLLLAYEIVERFHGKELAKKSHENFINRFSRKNVDSTDIQTIDIVCPDEHSSSIKVANVLKLAGLVSSTSEAYRLIKQGAVKMSGEKLLDVDFTVPVGSSNEYFVGKRRVARIAVKHFK